MPPIDRPARELLQAIDDANVAGQLDAPSRMPPPDQFWLHVTLDLIRKYRLNPLRASRALAYAAVVIRESVRHEHADGSDDAPADRLAREIAAATLLEFLFPEEPAGGWPLLLIERARAIGGPFRDAGGAWQAGVGAARAAIRRALADGSDPAGALVQPPVNLRNAWQATPPLWSSRPVEPNAARWSNWIVDAAIADQAPPPIAPGSAAYEQQLKEVIATARALTDEQRQLAESWNLDLGTVTPAGVWVLRLIEGNRYQTLRDELRCAQLALLTTVMLDAFIVCWRVKYRWWTERPVTAIRRRIDPGFLPPLVTPSFPGYISGHATVSGAAATVLGQLYPDQRDRFEHDAEMAALSRLYGGIHFRFDNDVGLAIGRKVGAAAIDGICTRAA